VFLSVPYLQELDALGVKITEMYRCCVDSHPTDLSTLEKLASIESRVALQFQSLESIPKEKLKIMRLTRRRRSVFMSLELKVDPSMYALNERVYEGSGASFIKGYTLKKWHTPVSTQCLRFIKY